MRHRKKFNHLSRKSAHRKETLSSLATALIINKRINTTIAKAKALRVYIEPLITKSKDDSTHSRRTVFGYLQDKHAVSELFREISPKIADRPGGYTRILKTGFRKGDAADMCLIELVDYNTNLLSTAEEAQQKRTRRGGRRKKGDEVVAAGKEVTAEKAQKKATEKSEEKPVDEVDASIETTVETVVEETPQAEADTPETTEEPKAEETEKKDVQSEDTKQEKENDTDKK